MSARLDEIAAHLPTSAGVYLYKDRKGRVIYVGKAVNVRARVRQYLSGQDGRVMVPFLVAAAHDIDCVVVATEKEALLLENTLIKKHRPRFNVKLRDDSNYLHLRLDLREPWPRYRVVRNIGGDGARYFGPYASAQKARETLSYLQRIFPLRTCTDAVLKSRKRPCILHQMGRCGAPCVGLVTPSAYQQVAQESTQLLEGRLRGVIDGLTDRMMAAAEEERFEEAARLRDLVRSIQATVEKQAVVDVKQADRDVWGVARDGLVVAIAVLPVREGVVSEPTTQVARGVVEEEAELLSSALNDYYTEGTVIPPQVLLPVLPPDHAALGVVLGERAGHKVKLLAPERGEKVELLALARANASAALKRARSDVSRTDDALAEIAKIAGLSSPPHRMECFDNSHLAGTNPVASMAVFLDGKPARQEYRRYRIKTAAPGDDYGAMKEILERRIRRGLAPGGELPDLLVIDGGKGQLGVVLAVLSDLGVPDLPVIGISKPRTEHARGERDATDKIVLPGVKDPLRMAPHHPALRMLQYLRDETHKTAVGYQRKVRTAAQLTTALDGIAGVGPARRKALLRAFGSVQRLLEVSESEIAAAPGVGAAVAKKVVAALQEG